MISVSEIKVRRKSFPVICFMALRVLINIADLIIVITTDRMNKIMRWFITIHYATFN